MMSAAEVERASRRIRGILAAVSTRAAGAALVLLVLSTLVFLALRTLPGDPATLILGDQASAEAIAALRQRLGFDQSLSRQYFSFLAGLLRLHGGDSLSRPGSSAFELVGVALRPTAALALLAVVLGALAGISCAVLAVGPWLGGRREWVHRSILVVSALPLLAFAPILTFVLAVRWQIVPLPGDPESGFRGLLFAAGLLSIPLGAQVARMGRAALLLETHQKYLEVARAKGNNSFRVWVIHALPVASTSITVVIAAQLGALLGGAVVLERLFELPGLGTLMLNAYATRDIPVLESAVVVSGLLFVVVQSVAAALNAWVDPRGSEGLGAE